jgi:hypothetical protein
MGRNNWMHFETATGLARYATFRSLIAACRALHVNPLTYLDEVLRLVRHQSTMPTRSAFRSCVRQQAPWSRRIARRASMSVIRKGHEPWVLRCSSHMITFKDLENRARAQAFQTSANDAQRRAREPGSGLGVMGVSRINELQDLVASTGSLSEEQFGLAMKELSSELARGERAAREQDLRRRGLSV